MRFSRKQPVFLVILLVLALVTTSTALAQPVHKDLFTDYSVENAMGHIGVLAATDDARQTGTQGEFDAADYIAGYFESIGLEVETQEFPITLFDDLGSELVMLSPDAKTYDTKTFQFSPSTPPGGLVAPLVYAGLGYPDDFEGKDFSGKIALIKRGAFTFYQKVQNAAAAGAVGVIIFNHLSGTINGTLVTPTDIPALAITKVDGEELVSLLDEGIEVTVKMDIQTVIAESHSQNVIGTKRAERVKGQDPQTIVVGAHYDCVDTPGANDNASGTATLMETARVMADKKLAYDVQFAAFGAEEIGLVGSEFYVLDLEEKGKLGDVVAMINMDMVGVGDTLQLYLAYDDTPTWLQDLFVNTATILGLNYDIGYSDRSDHANFEWFYIPSTFVAFGEDPYYHTDEDSIDKIDQENMYTSGTLVSSVLYQMAKTPMPKSTKGKGARTAKLHSYVKGEKVFVK